MFKDLLNLSKVVFSLSVLAYSSEFKYFIFIGNKLISNNILVIYFILFVTEIHTINKDFIFNKLSPNIINLF